MSNQNKVARSKNGVKVYYEGEEENYLRKFAKDAGFKNVQAYLQWKAFRERHGLSTDLESAKRSKKT